MHWLHRLLKKHQAENQLDAELRFHLERQISDYVASGMAPEEARRRANLDFGGLESIKQQAREARRGNFLETLLQDLRYAARMLRKSPGFTIAAVITLALGIGANTAIFSIVNAVILRPLPYKDSSRIVSVHLKTSLFPTFNLGLSWPAFEQIRLHASALEYSGVYTGLDKTLTGKNEPAILGIQSVSDGFFEELGTTAELGRLFTAQDYASGQNNVLVLSDTLWRTRFGASPSILGQSLTLDKMPYTVVGVAARGFVFPPECEAWLPISWSLEDKQNPMFFNLQFIGKLRRGQQLEQLRPQLDTIAQRLAQESKLLPAFQGMSPERGADFHLPADLLLEEHTVNIRSAYFVLLGAATLVLLIACANLASLLLARGSGRQREMALRSALGASPGRLLRQGLVESCLLALVGGGLGVILAAQGIDLFRAIAPANTPRLNEISVDSTLLWFSLVTSLVAGILFGLVPARRAARLDPNEALKEGAGTNLGGARSARQSRLGEALVTVEVALAFILLVGSALMTLTVSRLLHQNPGFRTDHLLSFDLPQQFQMPDNQADFAALARLQAVHFKEIVEKIQQIPGVAAVTASDHGVLTGMTMMQRGLQVDGAIPPTSKEERADARFIFPSYFQILGIPLVRGREFTDRDANETQRVVMVNEAMAREYWGTLDVLGKRISVSTEKGKPIWNEVVGVVADAREVAVRANPSPVYFLPLLQGGNGEIHLIVRTLTDPDALASTISREIWASYPDQPVTHLMTMSRNISESIGDERLRSILLVVFAGIGFALALVGVYGVISYSVARRIQEIGIRMALGASPANVLRMVIRQGLIPIAIGIILGAASAFALARVIASQLYGVKPNDPATFFSATALVLVVACAACFIPACRAMRVDPMVALRYQ
jgi:putative ABC transport system permease protein